MLAHKKLSEANRKTRIKEGVTHHLKQLMEQEMKMEQLKKQQLEDQCICDQKAKREERRRKRTGSGSSVNSKMSRAKT